MSQLIIDNDDDFHQLFLDDFLVQAKGKYVNINRLS